MSTVNHQCVHIEVWPVGYGLVMRKDLLFKKKKTGALIKRSQITALPFHHLSTQQGGATEDLGSMYSPETELLEP